MPSRRTRPLSCSGLHRPPGPPSRPRPGRTAAWVRAAGRSRSPLPPDAPRNWRRTVRPEPEWVPSGRTADAGLSASKGELGLQEQVPPGHEAARHRRGDGLADRSFVVVLALVGGVDGAEALVQGQFGQALRLLLLPGCPVQEAGNGNAVQQHGSIGHRLLLLWFQTPFAVLLKAGGQWHPRTL